MSEKGRSSGGGDRDGAVAAARTIASACLATQARRVERALTRSYNDELRHIGLTSTQLSLLVAAALSEPAASADIGRALGLEKSTVSRNLRLVEDRGWMVREGGPKAHWGHWALTDDGRAMIRAALPHWEKGQSQAERSLAAAERRMLGP